MNTPTIIYRSPKVLKKEAKKAGVERLVVIRQSNQANCGVGVSSVKPIRPDQPEGPAFIRKMKRKYGWCEYRLCTGRRC